MQVKKRLQINIAFSIIAAFIIALIADPYAFRRQPGKGKKGTGRPVTEQLIRKKHVQKRLFAHRQREGQDTVVCEV